MMSGQIASGYNGTTSAIDAGSWSKSAQKATIIEFPRQNRDSRQEDKVRHAGIAHAAVNAIGRALDASEMFCSLLFEDIMGCPYHLFSKRASGILAVMAASIAVVAIIAGA